MTNPRTNAFDVHAETRHCSRIVTAFTASHRTGRFGPLIPPTNQPEVVDRQNGRQGGHDIQDWPD
ncbi:hypothetical protein OKW41_005926 [Paraburkholderia sp. UCT70]